MAGGNQPFGQPQYPSIRGTGYVEPVPVSVGSNAGPPQTRNFRNAQGEKIILLMKIMFSVEKKIKKFIIPQKKETHIKPLPKIAFKR